MRRLSGVERYIIAVVLVMLQTSLLHAASPATVAVPATRPTTVANIRHNTGKDVVVLNELAAMYEAVPFSHGRHAQMAEMWNGCETCHHHTPAATTRPASEHTAVPSKADAAIFPACKSCHEVAPKNAAISMPSLKGAYHRQCLNCHREWMDSNACTICHAARPNAEAPVTADVVPQPDDITGRMHKPIPAPTTAKLAARFTPVAGPNVLFRHDEHTKTFGIRCVNCHIGDSCSACHTTSTTAPTTSTATAPATQAGPHPIRPGRTWRDTHGACANCHEQDHCSHCHYESNQTPPAAFDHQKLSQTLDKDHTKIACTQCHVQYRPSVLTCGDASCHKRAVSFPKDKPGVFVAPATKPTTTPTAAPAATQPTTRPVIIRIRRGGA